MPYRLVRALLPPALDAARARQATDWVEYLAGLQTQIIEAQAAAAETAERAAIQADAQGREKSTDAPTAPPANPDPGPKDSPPATRRGPGAAPEIHGRRTVAHRHRSGAFRPDTEVIDGTVE